ncbi:hypothetical protein TNCV_2083161 [Trichonephila clavipes]|nr:hypothetical protein TNCV_2083161 [Trichonephila clavipes]
MRLSDPVTAMHNIFLSTHMKWCTEVNAIDHGGPSYPPASISHLARITVVWFRQHDYPDFLKVNAISNMGLYRKDIMGHFHPTKVPVRKTSMTNRSRVKWISCLALVVLPNEEVEG